MENVRETLPSRFAAADVPSVAVAVARRGEVLWEAGLGSADKARAIPASTGIAYPVASITKPITATALMILVERGLVDLDRPINDYMGDARVRVHLGNDEEVTVRRIATHTAGLPRHFHCFPEDESWRRPPMDVSIARYGHIVSPPGERFEYANFGYGLLGYVVERVSGSPLREFLTKELFEPLGMTRSVLGRPSNLAGGAAERYDSAGSPLPFSDFDHPGACAVYSSAMDLLRFGAFHLDPIRSGNRLLRRETTEWMQAANPEAGRTQGYGIGWRTHENPRGLRRVFHDGRMGGVGARLVLVPTEDLVVVVLTNSRTDFFSELSDAVLGELLPGLREWMSARKGLPAKGKTKTPSFRNGLRGTWSGHVHTYRGDVPMELRIPKRGGVYCRIGGPSPTVVRNIVVSRNRLIGDTQGDIRTDDASRRPYLLRFDVTLRSGKLCGSVMAIPLPGAEPRNGLSHWCDLAPAPDLDSTVSRAAGPPDQGLP